MPKPNTSRHYCLTWEARTAHWNRLLNRRMDRICIGIMAFGYGTVAVLASQGLVTIP